MGLQVIRVRRADSEKVQVKRLTTTVYSAGYPVDGPTWASSNTGVATVDDRGTVVAVAAGDVTITATMPDSSTATFAITVVADADQANSFYIQLSDVVAPVPQVTGA